jgi:hypothetical protein
MVIQGAEFLALRGEAGAPPAAVDFVFRSGSRRSDAHFGEHLYGGGNGI